eukprot:CAMPEP_0174377158 /NCGR_PEP_ID=MMETSP0811_2-20130205/121086_1 /TAXON_ID=73025 ORGANISM="Eutreptiella gymnastica-like, Strain CCMP1594" /NCGR_SAMPLE_ID=MMETSP0811_2 /ASSEMBLY_ACC=CAM_ASM_000667 /LENGTH=48 /DNA_ID= /DNA_START= /DNA_END= /DNA_ORIENTATION=
MWKAVKLVTGRSQGAEMILLFCATGVLVCSRGSLITCSGTNDHIKPTG